jgi:hypothetical protein
MSHTITRAIPFLVLCLLLVAAPAFAQGVQSGTIRGVVTSSDGLLVPGATVMIASPALQGSRDMVTEETGAYTFPGLPPGDYMVTIALSGFSAVEQMVSVPLGGNVQVDPVMRPAGVRENVEVIAPKPTMLTTPAVGANYRFEEINALATPRTLSGIASLAPGVTQNAPNAAPTEGQSQLVINGAFGFDNVFMLNGVDVNDNVFGWPQNVFIEDAIAETQVLTSGISAEYGRFSGGVINAITKSGGNRFSGSYRAELGNDAWSTRTPFEAANAVERVSQLNIVHAATFGGPISRDRLWFFVAGRYINNTRVNTLPFTGLQYTTTDNNKRGELKLTGTIREGHTLQGSVLGNPRNQTAQANFTGGLSTIDPYALSDKHRPNHLAVINYKGVATPTMFLEAQYSQEQFSTDLGGGRSTSILDSPFLTTDGSQQYNAPYFDALDPDHRNNRQLTGSALHFAGAHELKAGYEWFRSQHIGGNSQSPSEYVFLADYATDAAGRPVFDTGGRLMPVFTPGETFVFNYIPTRGAELDIDHNSAYAQDHWRISGRLTADVGIRFEKVNSEASGGITGVDSHRTVPRLALAFDPSGRGKYVFHTTYAHYSGRYNDALIGSNSPVGNPIEIDGIYVGPAGQGRGFAAGFNPANYSYANIFASFPSANVTFAPGLTSPLTREFTASGGVELGGRGSTQLTYVWRGARDLIEDDISLANGTTSVQQAGQDLTLTNRVFRNSNAAFRDYQGLLLQARYEARHDLSLNGHWTLQLQNEGNYEGEAASQIVTSQIGDYPEIFTEARSYPTGRLANFQRHKVDLWAIYQVHAGRWVQGSWSGLWRYNSPRVYTLRALNQGITATQVGILAAAGYPDAPLSQTVYYGAPGSEQFAGSAVFDTSFNYDTPVIRSVRPWVKIDVFNLFNNQKLIGWNTTIRQDATTPRDALGLRTGYVKGALFGQATSNTNYPVPFAGQTGGRTLRIAIGLRF